jgi:subtilisin family serine protease
MKRPATIASILALTSACGPAPERALISEQSLDSGALFLHGSGKQLWIVQLDGPAAAEAWLGAPFPQNVARSRARLAEMAREHAALVPMIRSFGDIVGELTRLGNGFLVLADPRGAAEIARLPLVNGVELAPLHRPALASSVPITGAPAVWSGTSSFQGDGVRVGIIDSGVDYTHADFGGSGVASDFSNNNPTLVEPGSFPTARVVGGWDLVGDAYDASDPVNNTPKPDPDPIDCKGGKGDNAGGHGTHVASIAAGNGVKSDGKPYTGPYDKTLDPSKLKVPPGVAPRASLYALRVFGCGGTTGLLPVALDRAADPNLDGDFSDRLDVVNLSLGTSYGLGIESEAKTLANLTKVGTLVVAAAGNEGNTFFVNGAPGIAPEVLSVAASQDRVWLPLVIEAPASIAGQMPAAEGSLTKPLASVGTISESVVYANPPRGCGALTNAAAIAGRIALLDRGDCPFSVKLANVASAGALAAIVVDDELNEEPLVMGGEPPVPIPGVLVRRVHGDVLKAKLAEGVKVKLVPGARFVGPGAEPPADFSSRGPAIDDGVLKPDISAPGFDIGAANVASGSGLTVKFGTSMACPMAAGAAALARQAHPSFTPLQIKALLMNTAETSRGSEGTPFPTSRQGAGRVDVARASSRDWVARADGNTGSVALSFEPLIAAVQASSKRTALVENLGKSPATLQVTAEKHDALSGVTVSVSQKELVVPASGVVMVSVELSLDPKLLGAPPPGFHTSATQFGTPRHFLNEAAGRIRFTDASGASIALPYYGVVRAAGERKASTVVGCEAATSNRDLAIPIGGDSAHPAPVVTAFQLGAIDEENVLAKGNPAIGRIDVRAFGVATDMATATSIDTATLYFAVSVTRPWSTPARAKFSPVGVLIDTDENGKFDYALFATPFAEDKPYADVLVSQLHDTQSEPVGERRLLNMVSAGAADTAPFFNNVMVLPIFARDIGLGTGKTKFRYAAFGNRIETPGFDEVSDWVTYDIAKRPIDTAVLAPQPGRPLFRTQDPVRVRVNADVVGSEPPPKLLLLHHTNTEQARWEVVDLSAAKTEAIAVEIDTSPAPPGRVVRTLQIKNSGASAASVVLSGKVANGDIVLLAPSQGTCKKAVLSCQLGELLPNATAAVTLEIEAGADLTVDVQAQSANGCIVGKSETIPITTSAVPDVLRATGGCGCRTSPSESRGWHFAMACFLAFGLRRRLRRERRIERQMRAWECTSVSDGSYSR